MIKIKSPGRICLMGEHQDYLGFPVISMAISKYIYIKAKRISEQKIFINLPDMHDQLEITLNNHLLEYYRERDYLRSAYNLFIRKNVRFSKGYKIEITGDIPINAGVASSSALVVGWIYLLNCISNQKISLYDLAIEGYNAEVKEFGEGGGMMDHFTSTYGYLLYLSSLNSNPTIENFMIKLDGFVLGNSMEKKETVDDLKKVKAMSLESFKLLKSIMPDFNPFNTKLEDIKYFLPSLQKEHQKKIIGNIINRDLTLKTKKLIQDNIELLKNRNFKQNKGFYLKLGTLLNLHQEQLRDNIGISTKKIDTMLSHCLEYGAYGGKINGSGFGGTMFVVFPNSEKVIKKIIEETQSKAFIVKTSKGVEIY